MEDFVRSRGEVDFRRERVLFDSMLGLGQDLAREGSGLPDQVEREFLPGDPVHFRGVHFVENAGEQLGEQGLSVVEAALPLQQVAAQHQHELVQAERALVAQELLF